MNSCKTGIPDIMDKIPYFYSNSLNNLSVNEARKKTATLDENEDA